RRLPARGARRKSRDRSGDQWLAQSRPLAPSSRRSRRGPGTIRPRPMTQPRNPAEHHPTSTVRPPDFDAFWTEIMAAAERIALNPSIEPLAWRSTEQVDVFEIGYDSLDGVRIAGWYCVPRQIQPPYPGLLLVP